MEKSAIGLIGLGVMGSSLARNISNNGFKISVYNRTTEKTDEFLQKYGDENLQGASSLEEFVNQLASPRKIIIMVKSGDPVDAVIEQLKPLLDKDDILIDCGNENYKNTQRRFKNLEKEGFHFVGCGVSGGEEGALNGPSIMPGGSEFSWGQIKEIFTKISAKDFSGQPCVTYIGNDGAGHYVKMVHNGIEYGVMQIMAETYDLLRNLYNLESSQIAEIFKEFNKGKLKSYLFEIAVPVLTKKDEIKEGFLIDHILDKAAQKGTGKWTVLDAVERNVAVPSIAEAVNARFISNQKVFRNKMADKYQITYEKKNKYTLEKFIPILEDGVFAAMLSVYAQGYALIKKAAEEEEWEIDLAELSRIWEGGCIIRADILNLIHKGFEKSGKDLHLFEVSELANEINRNMVKLETIIEISLYSGISISGFYSAFSYYASMMKEKLPANFIQGLRDYFGAHTYERFDKEGTFHTDWD